MSDMETEALAPRERLHHGVAILAGLLASGKYHGGGSMGMILKEMETAEDDALEMVDDLAKKVGLKEHVE